MKPRASASFCHCPKLSSTPSAQVGPSWVSRPAPSCWTTSLAPARSMAAATAAPSSRRGRSPTPTVWRSEEHTSELQSLAYLVFRLLLEKKKNKYQELFLAVYMLVVVLKNV